MNIGIIGYGIVGKAVEHSFNDSIDCMIVDPLYSVNTPTDLVRKNVDVIFVCVNAPTVDNSLDITALLSILEELDKESCRCPVVIRTTLLPGVLNDIKEKFVDSDKLDIVYFPEFLRENAWQQDAIDPPFMLIAGEEDLCKKVIAFYKDFSCIRNINYKICSFIEASLVKYSINTFLATKVAYFNQLYAVYSELLGRPPTEDEWNNYISLVRLDKRMGDSHMSIPGPSGEFGYGGSCFPKDVKAFIGSSDKLTILREVDNSNESVRRISRPPKGG